MLVSIHRFSVYLNFKLQGHAIEVKQVALFVLHGNGYAIHVVVAAFRFTQNLRLCCLVGDFGVWLAFDIQLCKQSRWLAVEQVLPFVNQVAVNEVRVLGVESSHQDIRVNLEGNAEQGFQVV